LRQKKKKNSVICQQKILNFPENLFTSANKIDGTLTRGSKNPLPGSKEVIENLKSFFTSNKSSKKHIPFVFLSNGGGKSEKEKVFLFLI